MKHRALALAACLLAAVGCTEEKLTQLVVVIDTNLRIDQMEELDVQITRGDTVVAERTVDLAEVTWPQTIGLVYEAGELGPVRVAIEGRLGGLAVIERAASTSFTKNETRMVPMYLLGECLAVECTGENETCVGGELQCANENIAPSSLPAWSRKPASIGQCEVGQGDCTAAAGCETDLRTDSEHCGTCDTVCSDNHAVSRCEASACVIDSCESGHDNCDRIAANGCEADFASLENCGYCGHTCSTSCNAGYCDDESIVGLTLGNAHAAVMRANSELLGWGKNASGQLNDGTTTSRSAPVSMLRVTKVFDVAAGDGHTCMRTNSAIQCWGANNYGQLGDGTTLSRVVPSVPPITPGGPLRSGLHHTCAVIDGGSVHCWGLNGDGQLGSASTFTTHAVPVAVVGLTGVVSIGMGERHACAATAEGAVSCWGKNEFGQLGSGTTASRRSSPVTIPALSLRALGTGSSAFHSCGIAANGDVYCWGRGDAGQLGNGATTSTPIAVLVELPEDTLELALGKRHTCSRSETHIYCWGDNQTGALGIGNTGTLLITTPVRLNTALDPGTTPLAIAAGDDFTCALLSSGAVKCWGLNRSGQLGNRTTETQLGPVDVYGLPKR